MPNVCSSSLHVAISDQLKSSQIYCAMLPKQRDVSRHQRGRRVAAHEPPAAYQAVTFRYQYTMP